MKIRWKKLKTEADVHAAVTAEVGPGSSAAEVSAFAERTGMQHGPLDDGVIRAKVRGPRHGLLVTTTWLLVFHFDDAGTCTGLTVEEALQGP